MIIAIEGLGAAGKTSLINELKNQDYFIIPEIRDVIEETGDKQLFTVDRLSTMRVNNWFLKMEQNRSKIALEQTKSVLMERCIISQIAYNYAKDKLLNTSFSKLLLKKIRQANLVIPHLVYLRLPSNDSRNRMLVRNKHNEKSNILNNVENYTLAFNNYVFSYYELLMNILQDRILVIDANLDVKLQANRFTAWKSRLSSPYLNLDIRTLFLIE